MAGDVRQLELLRRLGEILEAERRLGPPDPDRLRVRLGADGLAERGASFVERLAVEGGGLADPGRALDEEELSLLEDVVLPGLRPALRVQQGEVQLASQADVRPDLVEHADALRTAVVATGRVEVVGDPVLPFAGTAFVVGPGLLLTNRHVARLVAEDRPGMHLPFVPGLGAGWDPLREELDQDATLLQVRSVRWIHPAWDAALLEVTGLDALGIQPLALAGVAPDLDQPMPVVAVGFPLLQRPARGHQDDLARGFGDASGVKRVMPGLLTGRAEQQSYGRQVQALAHDCATLGGASGAAIVDLRTGQVVGLQFLGRAGQPNRAVPAWELAADVRVRNSGVTVVGGVPTDLHVDLWPLEPVFDEDHDTEELDPDSVDLGILDDPPTVSDQEDPLEGQAAPAVDSGDEVAAAVAPQAAPRAAAPTGPLSLRPDALAAAWRADADRTRALLRQQLGDLADRHVQALQALDDGPQLEARLGAADPWQPTIVLVPGLWGSRLARKQGAPGRVWPPSKADSAEALALGPDGHSDRLPGAMVGPDGALPELYSLAALRWRALGHAVHLFSYDWRKSVRLAADHLHLVLEGIALARPGRRVVLVGHSTGGLVCAAYALRHPTWEQRVQEAVLLGTPLGGSAAIAWLLAGRHPLAGRLAGHAADDAVQQALVSMPGLAELLPDPDAFDQPEHAPGSPDGVAALMRPAAWPDGARPSQRWLLEGRDLRAAVRTSPLLSRSTLLVGVGQPTLAAVRPGDWHVDAPLRHESGDGVVATRAAVSDAARAAYALSGDHALLPLDAGFIDAVPALLRTGRCDLPLLDASGDPVPAPDDQADPPPPAGAERGPADTLWLLTGRRPVGVAEPDVAAPPDVAAQPDVVAPPDVAAPPQEASDPPAEEAAVAPQDAALEAAPPEAASPELPDRLDDATRDRLDQLVARWPDLDGEALGLDQLAQLATLAEQLVDDLGVEELDSWWPVLAARLGQDAGDPAASTDDRALPLQDVNDRINRASDADLLAWARQVGAAHPEDHLQRDADFPAIQRDLLRSLLRAEAGADRPWARRAPSPRRWFNHLGASGRVSAGDPPEPSWHRPRSIAQLTQVLQAVGLEKGIRVVGGSHASSDVAEPRRQLLDLSQLDDIALPGQSYVLTAPRFINVRDLPAGWSTVRLPAGMRLRDAQRLLSGAGLAFDQLPAFDGQSLWGAITTGGHGSGAAQPALCDYVSSIDLATVQAGPGGAPSVVLMRVEPTRGPTNRAAFVANVVSQDARWRLVQDDDRFRALLVSMGCMGVVFSVTMRVRPGFGLREERSLVELDQGTMASILALVEESREDDLGERRQFELLVAPYASQSGVHVALHTERQPVAAPDDAPSRPISPLLDAAKALGPSRCASLLDARSLDGARNRAHAALTGAVMDPWVGHSHDVTCMGLGRHLTVAACEVAVPFDDTQLALEILHDLLQRRATGDAPALLSLPYQVRFVRGSRAWLAPTYGDEDSLWSMIRVPVHLHAPGGRALLDDVEQALSAAEPGGRAHWGFHNNLTVERVRARWPAEVLEPWLRALRFFDPLGVFDNGFVERSGLRRAASRLIG